LEYTKQYQRTLTAVVLQLGTKPYHLSTLGLLQSQQKLTTQQLNNSNFLCEQHSRITSTMSVTPPTATPLESEKKTPTPVDCRVLGLIPQDWREVLATVVKSPAAQKLEEQLQAEYQSGAIVCPPSAKIFRSLELCPFQNVRVVILGQGKSTFCQWLTTSPKYVGEKGVSFHSMVCEKIQILTILRDKPMDSLLVARKYLCNPVCATSIKRSSATPERRFKTRRCCGVI